MIKVEDEGERISTEVSGTGEEILTQLSYLIGSLKTKMPKELIIASVKIGLEKIDEEETTEEDDEEDIEDILEDIKKIIKEAIENED